MVLEDPGTLNFHFCMSVWPGGQKIGLRHLTAAKFGGLKELFCFFFLFFLSVCQFFGLFGFWFLGLFVCFCRYVYLFVFFILSLLEQKFDQI